MSDRGKYEAVIGLEIHAEMLTDSKMFCGCRVVDSVEASPNLAVCPVCLGMPGMLPVINSECVAQAIRTGLGLKAEINLRSVFDRKNYFYPDLPQGYQISQYKQPIVGEGEVLIAPTGSTCSTIVNGSQSCAVAPGNMPPNSGPATFAMTISAGGSRTSSSRAAAAMRGSLPCALISTSPSRPSAVSSRNWKPPWVKSCTSASAANLC